MHVVMNILCYYITLFAFHFYSQCISNSISRLIAVDYSHRGLKETREYKERREIRATPALRESLDSLEKLVVPDHKEDRESLVTMEHQ